MNPSSVRNPEITMSSEGAALSADYDVNLNSKNNIIVKCDGDLSFNDKKNVTMESGLAIKIASDDATLDVLSIVPMIVKSNSTAMANIESAGPMIIEGAIVNIN